MKPVCTDCGAIMSDYVVCPVCGGHSTVMTPERFDGADGSAHVPGVPERRVGEYGRFID
jgi:hypothetical protein